MSSGLSAWLERRWYGGAPVPAWLGALEAVYRLGFAVRRHAYAHGWLRSTRLPVPVVVVSNITVGGTGKTPLVATLAQELIQRGEEVIYYNTEEFRSQIERTGATFRPYPTEMSSAQISELVQNGNLARVSLMVTQNTEHLLPFLLDDLAREQPDLVIFDALALWGKMAATLLNLRSAATIPIFVIEGALEATLSPREFLRLIVQALRILPGLLAARRRLIRHYGKAAFPTRPIFPVRGGLNISVGQFSRGGRKVAEERSLRVAHLREPQ